jgi:hypothetical protein
MSVERQVLGSFQLGIFAILVGLLSWSIAGAVTEQSIDYSPGELEELVGPVALYPDDLVAIVLPASSYPLQIVEAARYLDDHAVNADLEPDDDWDDSVVALLNYPEVVALLNEDLDWTWNLGQAVVAQPADVFDAIQNFRGRAADAGNLVSDDRQTVQYADEVYAIEPADPEVIYVPYYEPSRVVIYQSTPAYSYYPRAYPVYYYPYPAHYSFASGFFWGVTTAYTIGWFTDRVHYHHYSHSSHPYYGRRYTSHYSARNAGRVRHHYRPKSEYRQVPKRHYYGAAWKPGDRHGARPRSNQKRVASDIKANGQRANPGRNANDRSRPTNHSRSATRVSTNNQRRANGRSKADPRQQLNARASVPRGSSQRGNARGETRLARAERPRSAASVSRADSRTRRTSSEKSTSRRVQSGQAARQRSSQPSTTPAKPRQTNRREASPVQAPRQVNRSNPERARKAAPSRAPAKPRKSEPAAKQQTKIARNDRSAAERESRGSSRGSARGHRR